MPLLIRKRRASEDNNIHKSMREFEMKIHIGLQWKFSSTKLYVVCCVFEIYYRHLTQAMERRFGGGGLIPSALLVTLVFAPAAFKYLIIIVFSWFCWIVYVGLSRIFNSFHCSKE